ncbi:hypothetical protein [Hymenobacter seoulensis]
MQKSKRLGPVNAKARPRMMWAARRAGARVTEGLLAGVCPPFD